MIIKKCWLSVCLLSMIVSSGHAVFIGLTSLSNKENQQIILLSDAHMAFLEPMLKGFVLRGLMDEPTLKAFEVGGDEQCAIAPRLVSYLLNDKHSKKCLITETIGDAFCQMARLGQMEARFGITSAVKDPEVLFCTPRLLLRHAQSSGESLSLKEQLFDAIKAKTSYNYLNHFNVLLIREQFKWIAGDNRNQQEMLMGLGVPAAWPMLKELMDKKDPGLLADDSFQELTIHFLKKDMINCGTTFKQKGFDDQFVHKALAIINELLEKKELQENDHVVTLYDYLSGKNLVQELQDLIEATQGCCVKKFDAELQYYIQNHVMHAAPGHKPGLTCIMAGGMHTEYVQKYLSDYGFQTDYVVGVSQIKGSDFEKISFLEQLPGKIKLVNKAAQLLLSTESNTL